MKQTFTRPQLIRFIYKECSTSEEVEIRKWLLADESAMQEFSELQQAVQQLPPLKLEPSETSVRLILEESRKSSVQFSAAR